MPLLHDLQRLLFGQRRSRKDNLKPEYYEEFAHYLVDVCKHYKEEYGIEFRTLDPLTSR